MGASLERIRKSMSVQSTARDKGLVLELRIVAYDNGMIEVDGIPINVTGDGEPNLAEGWLGAATVALQTMHEFRRQVEIRQREKQAQHDRTVQRRP